MEQLQPAGLLKRLMALVYDVFLIFAIWTVTLLVWGHLVPAPPLDGEQPIVLRNLLLVILVVEMWGFYAWFWMRGGQTLGMRAWRLQVQDYRGGSVKLWQTVVRFLGACVSWALFGAGYLVVLIAPHQTLHDRLSATATVELPKKPKKS